MPAEVIADSTPAPAVDAVPALPEDFSSYRAARQGAEAEPAKEPAATEEAQPADGEKPPESAPESGPEKTPQEPKKPSGVEKRIGQLTRAYREEQRAREDLERKLAEATAAKPPEKPASAAVEGKPKPEDFQDYDAYQEALVEWKLDQRDKARAATAERQAQETAKAQQRRTAEAWENKVNQAVEKYPDFEEALSADVPFSPPMNQYAIGHEKGADVAYFLAKHPEEAARISELVPTAAFRELDKIVAQLDKPAEKEAPITETKPASKAPKPPVTVGGGAATATPSIYDERLQDNYPAWRAKRMRELTGR